MGLYDLEIIDLDVNIKDGKVVNANSSGNRVRGFEKTFAGKDANTFYEILPRILATCSQSHLYVYLRPHIDTTINRLLMSLEIIDSHLKHPYAYWFPHLIHDEEFSFPSGKKFKKVSIISRKIKDIMEKIGGKWPHVDYLKQTRNIEFIKKDYLQDVIEFIENEFLGMGIDDFLNVKNIEEFQGDLKLLVEKGSESLSWNLGLKNFLVVGFPFIPKENFSYSLIEDKGFEVTYDGKKVEVGPLAQAITFDPLVVKYFNKFGPSPLLREISRAKVLAKLLNDLKDLEFLSSKPNINDGKYVSFAESIRGSLIHEYEVEKGKITTYKILQPTTFIASHGGALENAVIGLPIKDSKNPVELSLTVSSLDTCFVTRVRVYENWKLVTTKRIGGFC